MQRKGVGPMCLRLKESGANDVQRHRAGGWGSGWGAAARGEGRERLIAYNWRRGRAYEAHQGEITREADPAARRERGGGGTLGGGGGLGSLWQRRSLWRGKRGALESVSR